MGRTLLSTREIGSVQRNDMDITTSGQAVITKVIAGTNVTISSTGVDAGTGDVTINASGSGGSADFWFENTDFDGAATTGDPFKLLSRGIAGVYTAANITVNDKGVITAAANGSAAITRSVSSISSNTAAGSTAATDYIYFVSGTTTLTLPTAVGNTNRYTIIHTDTNTTTIATTSSQTIAFYPASPATTATITVRGTVVELISDGANWWTI